MKENNQALGIVERAEKCIEVLKNNKTLPTTAQIRKFLSAVNLTANKVEAYKRKTGEFKRLSPELVEEVKYLQVMLVYSIGREKVNEKKGEKYKVRAFADAAGLLQEIKKIGNSVEAFETFCRYVEALVAYHKYYGGKD